MLYFPWNLSPCSPKLIFRYSYSLIILLESDTIASSQDLVPALSPSPPHGIPGWPVGVLYIVFQLGYFRISSMSFRGFLKSENLNYNLKLLHNQMETKDGAAKL